MADMVPVDIVRFRWHARDAGGQNSFHDADLVLPFGEAGEGTIRQWYKERFANIIGANAVLLFEEADSSFPHALSGSLRVDVADHEAWHRVVFGVFKALRVGEGKAARYFEMTPFAVPATGTSEPAIERIPDLAA